MNHGELKIYNVLQVAEIKEHQYYLSEKAGFHVCELDTLRDWTTYHAHRFREAYNFHKQEIFDALANGGLESIIANKTRLHELLKD